MKVVKFDFGIQKSIGFESPIGYCLPARNFRAFPQNVGVQKKTKQKKHSPKYATASDH